MFLIVAAYRELAMSRSVGVGLEGLQRLKMKSAELTVINMKHYLLPE